jgi:hypothetical protein
MCAPLTDTEMLRQLEESLLQPQVRGDVAALNRLLADDFVEFGASGQKYNKADIIAALPHEPPIERTTSDYAVRELGPGVALVTYHVVRHTPAEPSMHSLRSSIWVHRDGRWQMIFHQGTLAR